MNRETLKVWLDNFGMLYYRYLKFRASYLPTEFQRVEKEREPGRIDFYSQFIQKNDLVFDIGAHYGNRTSIFKKIGAQVVAIEPQAHCLKYLKKQFGEEIEIIPKVVSDSVGELELFFPKSKVSSASASLSHDWIDAVTNSNRFSRSEWNDSTTVVSTTLDVLIEEFGTPKFCKIDVEGHELSVLQGLSKTIAALSFEFTTPERKAQIIEAIELLLEINPDYQFNFCIGEDLQFGMKHWLDGEKIKEELTTNPNFDSKGVYGDIYCRLSPSNK